MSHKINQEGNSTNEEKIAEYEATQAVYLHYDSFRWQAGSLLIAGVFVFWGLLVSASPPPCTKTIGWVGVLVSVLMSIWVLFAHHYRQIYLCKLHRMHELEKDLSFEQHRRFLEGGVESRQYKVFGPKGHHLDLATYVFSSIGGSFVGWMTTGFDLWLMAPVPIVVLVTVYVLLNEHRITSFLNNLKGKENPT
jgi:hypothetical protein